MATRHIVISGRSGSILIFHIISQAGGELLNIIFCLKNFPLYEEFSEMLS